MTVTYGPWIWDPNRSKHFMHAYEGQQYLGVVWEGSLPEQTPRTEDTQQQLQFHEQVSTSPPTGNYIYGDNSANATQYHHRAAASSSYYPSIQQNQTDRTYAETSYDNTPSHTRSNTQGSFYGTTGQTYGADPYSSYYSTHGRATETHYPTQQPTGHSYYTEHSTTQQRQQQAVDAPQPPISSLPPEVANTVRQNDPRRFIRTGTDPNDNETLDSRYRRVKPHSQPAFFVTGRVFKVLWTEPAGQANPGRSREGTHFSLSMVRFGEYAYTEIRRFVVIRNCGTFSQCVPIHTYRGQATLKPNINTQDHGMIFTTDPAPNYLAGENLSKQPIFVQSTSGEQLEAASRVNYGKPYAVEHNVKVLDIGRVCDVHIHMLQGYFDLAVTGR